MSTTINDITADGVSDCCSAKVTEWGVCFECKEHCGIVDEEEDMPEKLFADRGI